MDKYSVRLLSLAYTNIDEIYSYIANELQSEQNANSLVDELEKAIFSLEHMPFRGSVRKVGLYANKNYRQLIVKNYTIIYRINENSNEVIIVTVIYSKRDF